MRTNSLSLHQNVRLAPFAQHRRYAVHSTGTRYRDNTVLVSPKDTSAPTVIKNLELETKDKSYFYQNLDLRVF